MQNPEQLFVAQVLIKNIKLWCCGNKDGKKVNSEALREEIQKKVIVLTLRILMQSLAAEKNTHI